MRLDVARHEDGNGVGHMLGYNSEDVEAMEWETPRDLIDVTPPEATSIKHKLGQAHLHLHVHFKPGTGPSWEPIKADKEE